MHDLFQRQMEVLENNTHRQVVEMQRATETQIRVLQETAQKQIENYSRETSKMLLQLVDNSVFLAELLKRELETTLAGVHEKLSRENAKYVDLKSWKLGRTPAERNVQLKKQLALVDEIKRGFDHLYERYRQVCEYLKGKE